MTSSSEVLGSHDFDFLFGSWSIVNRRLISRLTGSDEWETFIAEGTCQPILGGIGNIDDFRPEWPSHEGFIGGSFRFFDLANRTWSIYWADNATGVLQPPVVGKFKNGVGTFIGEDEHAGAAVLARFIWSGTTTGFPNWEQAFSLDDGETWETNWTMAFTPVPD